MNRNKSTKPGTKSYYSTNRANHEKIIVSEKPVSNESVDKYEIMLKKVNSEFQDSLKKNTDLNNEIAGLELKLHRSQIELENIKDALQAEKHLKKTNYELIELENHDLQKANVDLNRVINEKNSEIERLKKLQFELENKLLNTDNASLKMSKTEHELREKIEELLARYSHLDQLVNERDNELYKAKTTIEVLQNDLRNMDHLESNHEFEIKELKNERDRYYELVSTYKEKLFKSSTVLKQVMSECEDLKREKSLIQNNSEFSKNLIEQLKSEISNQNIESRLKIQKLKDENVILKDKFR